jgi:glycine/D-amino acid oxidase-like deaminating enzyme
VQNLGSLGGRLRLGTKVESILVERDTAVGVRLAGGETIAADWVISAADGHATLYDLLGGKYVDNGTAKTYGTLTTFPSYLQVSLGVMRDLREQAGYVTRLLDTPLMVDPRTRLRQVSFRFFHFDPTFRRERPRSRAFYRRMASTSGLSCSEMTRRSIRRRSIASPMRSSPSWREAWLMSARLLR